MKSLTIGLCVAAAAMLSGCVMCKPCNAFSPIELDVVSPGVVVDNSVKPEKCGVATAKGVLCYTEGDASIQAAMKNGGIKKIHHIDYKVNNIFGIVGSTTTQVYGE